MPTGVVGLLQVHPQPSTTTEQGVALGRDRVVLAALLLFTWFLSPCAADALALLYRFKMWHLPMRRAQSFVIESVGCVLWEQI